MTRRFYFVLAFTVVALVGAIAYGSGGSGGGLTLFASTIRFLDNTANALCLQEGTNRYFCATSTNGSEVVTASVPLTAASGATVTGTITMAGSTQIVSYSSSNGNQLNFTTCDGSSCFNQISIPDNVPNGLRFREQSNGTALLDFITTTTTRHMLHGVPLWGTPSTVAAAGANQSNAAVIPQASVMVTVTGCDGTKGVALPSGSVANAVRIMSQSSTSTNTCLVYGNNNDNDTINGGSADASYTQIAGSSLLYQTDNGTNWFTY